MKIVTEGGYFQDESGKFDPQHPRIVHDAQHPDQPETAFGCIVEGLKKRREAGDDPFTVMCCDNVPHGGEVVRNLGKINVCVQLLLLCVSWMQAAFYKRILI